MSDNNTVPCVLCGRHVIADAIVSHAEWAKISPTGDENGYLCPACVVERAVRILGWSAARLTDARKRREETEMTDFIKWAMNEVDHATPIGIFIYVTLLVSFIVVGIGIIGLFVAEHYFAAALILPGIPVLLIAAAYIGRDRK